MSGMKQKSIQTCTL